MAYQLRTFVAIIVVTAMEHRAVTRLPQSNVADSVEAFMSGTSLFLVIQLAPGHEAVRP
jgi:hypothetical protein